MRDFFWLLALAFLIFGFILFIGGSGRASDQGSDLMEQKPKGYPVAYFAGGCFWCVESEFRSLEGVVYTRAGYMGGHLDNPKYEDTHDSKSGHAEAVEVTFDPAKTSYETLLTYFMTKAHDPTQFNRQGPDVGTQYRSALFPVDEAQKETAEAVIKKREAEHVYNKPIVTTIEPLATFWEAESYHQQYYEKYEEKNGRPHINDWLARQRR